MEWNGWSSDSTFFFAQIDVNDDKKNFGTDMAVGVDIC